jgi:hypothetical protein
VIRVFRILESRAGRIEVSLVSRRASRR